MTEKRITEELIDQLNQCVLQIMRQKARPDTITMRVTQEMSERAKKVGMELKEGLVVAFDPTRGDYSDLAYVLTGKRPERAA